MLSPDLQNTLIQMDEKNQDSIGYAFKGKIMISSVVILFVACLIIVLFHVFGRGFRDRHRHLHLHLDRRRRRRTDAPSAVFITSQGLDSSAVDSIPMFVYESKKQGPPPECAVCLSEFEDNEVGRVLPECEHCFHVNCIDMWLLSHPDCPLCRTRVRVHPVGNLGQPGDDSKDLIVSIDASGNMSSGSGSGPDRVRQSEGIHTGGSSSRAAPDVPRQSTGPMDQEQTKIEGVEDPDGNGGSDIESGSKTPGRSVRVLKGLFNI